MRSSIGTVGGMVQKKEVDSAAAVADCVARTMHQYSVFWVSYFAR